MKRKIFTLFVAASFGVMAIAQDKPNVNIPKVTGDFTLDGVADASVAGETANDITLDVDGGATLNSASWKAAWNDNGIYVVVSVDDDVFYTAYSVDPAAADTWNYDKPEIYFDFNATLEDGVGGSGDIASGHKQLAPTFVKDGDGVKQDDAQGWSYAHKVTGTTYVFEYFLPFSYVDAAIADDADITGYNTITDGKSRPIGFDVTVIDRDAADDGGRLRKNWANDLSINESWNNMDGCGTITLTTGGDAVRNAFVKSSDIMLVNNELVNINGVANVYDLTGKLVLKGVANGTLNVSALKSGVYVVKANKTAKFVK